MTDTKITESQADASGPDQHDEDSLVPGWLAILVLLLLLAVVGVAGFVVRGFMDDRASRDPVAASIAAYQKEVATNPADSGARLNLAYTYQQARRYDDALAQYDEVLRLDPQDLAALYNKGVIAYARGDKKAAEEWWWKVLALDPAHALAAKSLGDYYASNGHYRSLIEAVRPAVEAKPSLADLQYLMGMAYEKLGKTDWARERYRLALQYAPDMTEARAGYTRMGGTP